MSSLSPDNALAASISKLQIKPSNVTITLSMDHGPDSSGDPRSHCEMRYDYVGSFAGLGVQMQRINDDLAAQDLIIIGFEIKHGDIETQQAIKHSGPYNKFTCELVFNLQRTKTLRERNESWFATLEDLKQRTQK